jgi:hypothetical protein
MLKIRNINLDANTTLLNLDNDNITSQILNSWKDHLLSFKDNEFLTDHEIQIQILERSFTKRMEF